MKVRILKGDSIGKVFNVSREGNVFYYIGEGIDEFSVRKQDAEVVEDVEKPTIINSCKTCGYTQPCNRCEDANLEKWIPNIETKSNCIAGVGQDAPTVINEQGGKQSAVMYAFDCLDPKAMFAMCKVLKEGRDKYGTDSNWRRIPVYDHLNHLLIHVFAFMAGDTSDNHLSHALCRAMFALAVADNSK